MSNRAPREIDLVECMILDYMTFVRKRYDKLGDRKYESIYGKWDRNTWTNLRNLMFKLVTGEDSFDSFYDRFSAPATDRGTHPVAWGPRFWPDMINDLIWDTTIEVEEKIKGIKELYDKSIALEKAFKEAKAKPVEHPRCRCCNQELRKKDVE